LPIGRLQRLESPFTIFNVRIEFRIPIVQAFDLPPCLQVRFDIRQSKHDDGHLVILRFCAVNQRLQRFGVVLTKARSDFLQPFFRLSALFRGKIVRPVEIVVSDPNHN
jgi:hypothetical protein